MTRIEANCPSCGKENIIGMKFHEPEGGGVAELLTAIFGDAGIKHYAFSGDGQCVHGSIRKQYNGKPGKNADRH